MPKPNALLLALLICSITVSATAGQTTTRSKPYITFGIFIGKIEEGARIFTPIRLLPFEHPESQNHQFPNPLQLQDREYECLVFVGEKVGLKLAATLQRYPQQPTPKWNYPEFEIPPLEDVKTAGVKKLNASRAPIPGLKAVVYKDRSPICFIVDTRRLSLRERHMQRATSMGLDLSRSQFLNGLEKASLHISQKGTWILIFR